MTIDKLIRTVIKLQEKYKNEYKLQPDTLLIDARTALFLYKATKISLIGDKLPDLESYEDFKNYTFMGLKINVVEHCEMQVYKEL